MKITESEIVDTSSVPLFTTEPARNSEQSHLPTVFAYVAPDVIGTHELVNNARADQVVSVLDSLLKEGYRGPAITVIEAYKDEIFYSLQPEKPQLIATLKYGQVGIADGHNRLAALQILRALGLLKHHFIPVQVIPGRKPNMVMIRASKDGETALSVEQICDCFVDPKRTIDPTSTSHFESSFSDGQWRRVREGQPDIVIKREELLDLDRLNSLTRGCVIDEGIQKVLATYSLSSDAVQALISQFAN